MWLFLPILFLCVDMKREVLLVKTQVKRNQAGVESCSGAAAWILELKQTSNRPQTPTLHLSFTQQGQKLLSPFYHLFPNLRSDLQLSSLRNAVHLSTSMTLTISSHCSSPSLQPWPAFFRPGSSPATAPDWHEWHYRIQRLIKTNCSLLIPLHHLQRQSNTYSTDTIMSRHGAQQNTWNSL